MAFEHLKPRPATRITSAWGTALIDALNLLYGWLTDGTKDISVDEVLANYGFFSQNVFVQGKPVIKDGDPITVYDIADYAREKITEAIDLARVSRLADVYLDEYGRVGVAVYDDKVGLAREATLSSVSAKLNNLDVQLSTRASESTLQGVLGKLDVALSTRASESTLSAIRAQADKLAFDAESRLRVSAEAVANPPYLDTALSTRASESTLQGVLGKLDELGKLAPLGSTTTPLAANAEWVSPVDDSVYTRYVCGSAYADQPGTLYVEQSPDGSNWDVVDSFSVSAGTGLKFSVEKVLPYLRVRYVNGAADQTVFRLYAYRRLRV